MTVEAASVVSSAITNTDITFYLSIAAALISLATFVVGYSQMRIASAKTKLDLYNKRFGVYLAVLEYYQDIRSEVKDILKVRANKFIHSVRESKFLFDTKDGVCEALKRIQKNGAVVRAYEEYRNNPNPNPGADADLAWKLFNDSETAYLEMVNDILKLEGQLKKYISFHNVMGWKFWE